MPDYNAPRYVVKRAPPKQKQADPQLLVYLFPGLLVSPRMLPQIMHMLLQFTLWDLDVLDGNDQFHLLIAQAQTQTFVGVLRGRAIRQFLFAVLHFKKIDVMWIVE